MKEISRRNFIEGLTTVFIGTVAASGCSSFTSFNNLEKSPSIAEMPNIILINADDLGYGTLNCYGGPKSTKTPNIDKLASNGIRCTSGYSAFAICTPSRCTLMTGRWPQRVLGPMPKVLHANSAEGLGKGEVTIADALKSRGYATSLVGKWHLGDRPEYLPTMHGFDRYFGIPYSNDMKPSILMDGTEGIQNPVDLPNLTSLYAARCVEEIKRMKDGPFFLYYASWCPHVPLNVSESFKGSSKDGIHGDAIQELDASIGALLKAVEDYGLSERTLIVFTSDNGATPYLSPEWVNRPLRGAKGTSWEGGVRIPMIFSWTGKLERGECDVPITHADLAVTLALAGGGKLAEDRKIDGRNIMPALLGQKIDEKPVGMFRDGTNTLCAVRLGKWKLHISVPAPRNYDKIGGDGSEYGPLPWLFDLDKEIGETKNVAAEYPDVVTKLKREADKVTSSLETEK